MKNFLLFSMLILLCSFVQLAHSQTLIAGFEEQWNFGQNPVPDQDNYTVRKLNKQVYPVGKSIVTLSNDGIKFSEAGTYMIFASAPAYFVNSHRLTLDDKAGKPMLLGTSEYASYKDHGNSTSQIMGVITVPANSEYFLNHYTQTVNSDGTGPNPSLGVNASVPNGLGAPETFTQLWVWKIK